MRNVGPLGAGCRGAAGTVLGLREAVLRCFPHLPRRGVASPRLAAWASLLAVAGNEFPNVRAAAVGSSVLRAPRVAEIICSCQKQLMRWQDVQSRWGMNHKSTPTAITQPEGVVWPPRLRPSLSVRVPVLRASIMEDIHLH